MKFRLIDHCSFNAIVLLLVFSFSVNAIPARKYTIFLNGDRINLERDHYSVELVGGRISSKDNIARALLSKNTSLVGSFEQRIMFFDSTQTSVASIIQETDLSRRKIDRPISKHGVLIDNLPGDAQSHFVIRFAVNREEQLTQIFEALEQNAPGLQSTTDIVAGPWVGYTKAAIEILNKVFDASKTKFPLLWDGDIRVSDVISNGEMRPHYIVLLAPLRDSDTILSTINESQLSFADGKLLHGNVEIVDRSYIILKVVKSGGYNIRSLVDSSDAPWATFARTQLTNPSTMTLTNQEQLTSFAVNMHSQLKAEESLLQRERRFSGFDRAVAMVYFADLASRQINRRCTEIGLSGTACPTGELQAYVDNYLERHRMPNQGNAARTVKTVAGQLISQ